MSERLGSEAMLEIVNGLFDRLVPVIERYGGVIDKFIGDEIMAVFGAPRAVEHHAEHALRAALEIFAALADYNRERSLELGLHIGANTGPVIAGAVGSHARHDYSVTGDTVNVAARLEGAAKTGQILVGPSTFRHTVQLFEFEALEPLALKGKMRPLDVYRLLGETPRAARSRVDGLQLRSPDAAANWDCCWSGPPSMALRDAVSSASPPNPALARAGSWRNFAIDCLAKSVGSRRMRTNTAAK